MNFDEWLDSKTLSWALSAGTVQNMESAWNAAIDEAVKVVSFKSFPENAYEVMQAEKMLDSIKELKK